MMQNTIDERARDLLARLPSHALPRLIGRILDAAAIGCAAACSAANDLILSADAAMANADETPNDGSSFATSLAPALPSFTATPGYGAPTDIGNQRSSALPKTQS